MGPLSECLVSHGSEKPRDRMMASNNVLSLQLNVFFMVHIFLFSCWVIGIYLKARKAESSQPVITIPSRVSPFAPLAPLIDDVWRGR